MKHVENVTWREWLDLELDGALPESERESLRQKLADDPELAAERQRLQALHALMGEDRVVVRPDFAASVMAALPVPPWRAAARRAARPSFLGIPSWGLPLAVLLALTLGATWLLADSGFVGTGAIGGTVVALFDLARASVLAGSGLLFATWKGVGWGLAEMLGGSWTEIAMVAVFVLCLDLLFLNMLRRRPAVARARQDAEDEP